MRSRLIRALYNRVFSFDGFSIYFKKQTQKKREFIIIMVYCKSEKGLVDSLVQTVRIFNTDIPVNIGIEKYAVLVMKRGKEFKSEIRNVVKAKIDKS